MRAGISSNLFYMALCTCTSKLHTAVCRVAEFFKKRVFSSYLKKWASLFWKLQELCKPLAGRLHSCQLSRIIRTVPDLIALSWMKCGLSRKP